MAQTYGYFNSINGDRQYNADQMSEYFNGLVSNGVYSNVGGALQVMASSGMNVQVKTGRAIIGNCKWFKNDAVLTVPITQSHPTLNRYTAIVIRLSFVNRTIGIYAKDGTPASTATKPAMQNDETMVELCLAYIYVKAGATSISQANITDMRASSSCGWVTGLVKQVDTSQLFLQWQTAYQNYYDTMTRAFNDWFDTLTSQLKVETYISDYYKRVVLSSSQSSIVPLDMAGYEYESSDIISVYINGLYAAPNVDYFLDTSGSTAEAHINATANGTEICIVAIKSKIGFTQLTASDGSAVVGSDGSAIAGGESDGN